jgi:hypothetical protein
MATASNTAEKCLLPQALQRGIENQGVHLAALDSDILSFCPSSHEKNDGQLPCSGVLRARSPYTLGFSWFQRSSDFAKLCGSCMLLYAAVKCCEDLVFFTILQVVFGREESIVSNPISGRSVAPFPTISSDMPFSRPAV